MKEEGQDIINLAGGEPDFKTPSPIIERAYADMKAGFTSYVQSQGLPELRRKLAQKLQMENGIDAVQEGILVTASTKLALFIGLFTCLQPAMKPCILSRPMCPISHHRIDRSQGRRHSLGLRR